MKKYVNWAIFAGVGLLLAIAVTLFHYFVLPIAIRYQVIKTLTLEEGTEAWDRFLVTPIPIILKVYFFKLENPEAVLREQWYKKDVKIDKEQDTIFYRQAVNFTFDAKLSGGLTEDDNVTVTNAITHLLMSIIGQLPTVDIMGELLEFGLPELLGDNFGPSLTFRVRDLLFDGITIPCNRTGMGFTAKLFCSAIRNYQPITNVGIDQYGNPVITALKFREVGPLFEMYRGADDVDKMGRIKSIDGKTKLDSWWCDSANTVNGYDMVMFPPFLSKDSKIPLMSPEIKTSVNMEYEDDSSYKGIDGYKMGPVHDFLADVRDVPSAKCFCPGSARNITIPSPCLPGRGVMDLSSTLDIPVLLSLPHLYQASDNWKKSVDGLNPSKEKHESFLSIEPTTGVPLQGFRRVQINIKTKPLPALKMFKKHADAIIPIVWIEEGTGLGEKEISMIRDQLLKVLYIVMVVRWCIFSVGLTMLIGGTVMSIWRRRQELSNTQTLDQGD